MPRTRDNQLLEQSEQVVIISLKNADIVQCLLRSKSLYSQNGLSLKRMLKVAPVSSVKESSSRVDYISEIFVDIL